MRLLSKLAGTAPKKGFTQSPFWSLSTPIWDSVVGDKERIANDFGGYVQQAYKGNGIVFACVLTRLLAFSEARFAWQQMENGRPSQLLGGPELALLERPWRNGTTGELLARMEQDSSLAGNAYLTIVGQGEKRRLRRLRPDWVTILLGSESKEPDFDPNGLDAEIVAYGYMPGGRASARQEILLPSELAHFSPIPDPVAQYRGMSWMTPILREVEADSAATKHKGMFFKHGATPNIVVRYDKDVGKEAFERFVAQFRERQEGVDNAYRTLHVAGGADVSVVGANLRQLEFKVTQGAGETRIAAAAGTPPAIVGLSEGLQGSTLNAGNFAAAKRRFADMTIRPLWRIASASLEPLVAPPPAGAHLWYDDRDVAFLREDAKDAVEILGSEATAIAALLTAGFGADSAIDAVTSGDLRRLAATHSGLFSVQLRPPGTEAPPKIDPTLVEAAGALIRAGFDPAAALAALGLPPITHTGLRPITLQDPENSSPNGNAPQEAETSR